MRNIFRMERPTNLFGAQTYGWAAQPVVVGDNVPHFWDQQGTGGTGGGPMKTIFASTADSLYSVL